MARTTSHAASTRADFSWTQLQPTRDGARPRALRRASSVTLLVLALCGIAASAHAQSAEETVPLAGLVTEAEGRNPEILRARHAVSAAHEVPSRAGSLPDPMISVSLQNVPFNDIALNASPMTGILVSVSQVVPFPGKLGRREEYAQANAVTAERDADLVRALVAFRVRDAYWRLSFAERAYEITSKSERVINSLADAAVERFSVAMAPQQDALHAEVDHSRLRANLERRRQEVVSARRALNGAVGRAPDAPLGKTQGPPRPPPKLDFDRLNHAVDQGNPRVVAARARVGAAERAIAEAKKDRLPDFQLGAGYRIRAEAQGDTGSGERLRQGGAGAHRHGCGSPQHDRASGVTSRARRRSSRRRSRCRRATISFGAGSSSTCSAPPNACGSSCR